MICLAGAGGVALALASAPACAAGQDVDRWLKVLNDRSPCGLKERRRPGFDRQRHLVQVGQVVKVVGRDGAAGQAIDRDHQVGGRNLPAPGAFPEADGGLGDPQFAGYCRLSKRHFLAPLRKSHPEPPGTGVGADYCARLYFDARYKQMADANYFDLQSNVLVMRPGNRLRDLRKAAGLTQMELAEATGVSQPAISQIENGALSMDIAWMRTFARVLKCAPADLLDDDDNPNRLSEEERELLERFRHADRAQRANLARVAAALIPDPEEDAAATDAAA